MRGQTNQEKTVDFTGRKVTIMGLGIAGGGVADALFFLRAGATVTVTDKKTEEELARSVEQLAGNPVVFHLGGHQEQDFIDADLVVRNPGVPDNSPYLEMARSHGVPVEMGSGIFAEYADMSRLIGVTGTKGKSTTTALIHRVLQTKYPNAYHGGDVDGSPTLFVENANRGDWGVMELSSWRLEGMAPHKKSPHIAVITSIAQDHLNRYESYEAYKASKKLIFAFQGKDDIAILNYDSDYLRGASAEVPSRLMWFSATSRPTVPPGEVGCFIEEGSIHYGDETFPYDSLKAKTMHHPGNIAATLSVAMVLGIPFASAREAIEGFEGLFGRLQKVTQLEGVPFYNDTAATNPYATKQSISTVGAEGLALIVGGEDKDLDFSELAASLKNVPFVFLLPGTASDKLLASATSMGVTHIQTVATLQEAVAGAWAASPKAVLFSPGAASFNMFKNEFDRGEQFIREVERLEHDER
jgi:UDP-N-acetylmuramoylalanine--D-glutamate ligase